MGDNFINRNTERTQLKHRIFSKSTRQITFVTGISGIGKSAFTEKVISDDNCAHIRFRINDLFSSGNIEQGTYIKGIAQEIDNYYQKQNAKQLTIKYFFNHLISSDLKKRAVSIMKNETLGSITLGGLVNFIINYIFKLDSHDTSSIFASTNNDILLCNKFYIKYILNRTNLLLVIENYQSIDHLSYKILNEVIQECTTCNFIFEFTINNPLEFYETEFQKSQRSAYPNIDLYWINLTKMELSAYMKICADNPYIISALTKLYYEFDGNIRQLDAKTNLYLNKKNNKILSFDSNLNNLNFLRNRLLSIDKNSQLLLCAIVTHQKTITFSDLNYFIDSKYLIGVWIDLRKCISNLQEQGLLKIINNDIFIEHDYIASQLIDETHFERYIIICRKIWIEHYKDVLNNRSITHLSKNNIYHILFNLYLAAKDYNQLFKLIPEVKRVVLESAYPTTTIEYINCLKDYDKYQANIEIQDTITFALIDIYYTLGLFDKAWELLDDIKDTQCQRFVAYYAMLLNRLDRNEDAIKFILNILPVYNPTSRITFILNLILMISYRGINLNDECHRIYTYMMALPMYKEFDEYGFLLRNSEMILPLGRDIIEVKRSIQFFRKRKLYIEMGQSYLTLSLLNIWNDWNYKDAISNLNIAESLLIHETIERHIFLNNREAIHMYQGDFSEEVGLLLKESRKTIMCNFDNLTICINNLIYYSKTKHSHQQEQLDIIDTILELIQKQPDRVMHRLAYFTIAQYYQNIDSDFFNLYMHKAMDVHSSLPVAEDDYWSNRFVDYANTNYVDNSFMKYDIGMISYWHFRIPSDL